MQFSAIVNRFIVKTYLNSAFTNDLKRKYFFLKNVHSSRLSLFKWQNPCINQAIHLLLMHRFCALHIHILGRHKNLRHQQ